MGEKKVVVDTNVFISAFGWDGIPEKVLNIIDEKGYIIYLSENQLKEIQRVINYPRLNLSEKEKAVFLKELLSSVVLVKIKTMINIIKEDSDDNIIISTAIENNCDYIISGDNHLLQLKQYKHIRILTPAQFFSLLENKV
ncbi:putative toxin-antitoxin system toxin component, PIN family [Candidatus Woesearchaeota archaeon]|nr:putative toxin-antitoxin system toxin component, PIN family [Candidatus Woesearchaeota archaeon]